MSDKGVRYLLLAIVLAIEPLLEELRRTFWFLIPAERKFMAYADDLTVLAHRQDLTVLFARMNVFCEGTQLQIQRSNCQIYQPKGTSMHGRTEILKTLGTPKGDPRVCAELEQKKILKALWKSNIFFQLLDDTASESDYNEHFCDTKSFIPM